MQLLAFGLIVTAGLLIHCEPSATQTTEGTVDVNMADQAEQSYLDKCRDVLKEYVEKLNKKSVTIVLDKVTKQSAGPSGIVYNCFYTAAAGVSNKCTAFVSFNENKEFTKLTKLPCYV